MASCDMCGKETKLFNAKIEGTVLNVCKSCSKYGNIIKKTIVKNKYRKFKRKLFPEQESKEGIVKNFHNLVRKKRENMGLKQKEFAKMLAEKESIIHKIESGSYKPSISLAKKMQKKLGIKLIEEVEEKEVKIEKKKGTFTIGDMIDL